MLIGGGVVEAMQKAYKANRELSKRKRSKNDPSFIKLGIPLKYKKASDAELEKFREEMKRKKKKELRITVIVFSIFVGIPVAWFFYYFLFG